MFGQLVKKQCPVCDVLVSRTVSVVYLCEGKEYVTGFKCPTCDTDLVAEETAMLNKARSEGKSIAVMMV